VHGQGTIKGKVTENDGKTPVEAAIVQLMQNKALISKTVTNKQGFFTLNSVPVGKYDVKIICGGYDESIIKGIEVKKDSIKNIGVVKLVKTVEEKVIEIAEKMEIFH
jgi:hypothetical protein